MKSLIVILTLAFLGYQSQAQRMLKITKAKLETYDPLSGWSNWKDPYTYFEEGSEPVLKITNLDDQGSDFLINYYHNGSDNAITVSYKEYDGNNNWYKYVDENGDEICIVGATMSSLAQNGWPRNLVQIYLWIYSDNYALLYE